MACEIQFVADVREHLKALTIPERLAVFNAVELQLVHEPLVETRNRKPLRPNPIAPWALRVAKLRVFYEDALAFEGVPSVGRVCQGAE